WSKERDWPGQPALCHPERGLEAAQSGLQPQSKDPIHFHATAPPQGVFANALALMKERLQEFLAQPSMMQEFKAILRLRMLFASRTACCAQDDKPLRMTRRGVRVCNSLSTL